MADADDLPYLCPPFVLRMAGFPFSWLGELADPPAVAATGPLLSSDPGSGTEAAARGRFLARHQEALERTRGRVGRHFTRDSGLRDMLFALNPAAYPIIMHWLDRLPADPGQWRAKDRAKLDTLTLYLQRACAKNDTTGGAGPFAVGRFDPDTLGIQAPDAPLEQHSFLARWVADAVLECLAGTPEGTLVSRPRRAPGVALNGAEVDHLPYDYHANGDPTAVIGTRRRHRLTPADRGVLALCDGDRTPADIAADLPADGAAASTGAAVERSLWMLADAGLIVRGPELPYGMHDPLPALAELAKVTGSTALAEFVGQSTATLKVMASGDLAERRAAQADLAAALEATIGHPPAVRQGGFYSDRALTFEETVGRFDPLILGRELTGWVHRALPLIIDTYMLVPRARFHAECALMADWFGLRFPAGTASVHDYLDAFVADLDRLRPAFDEVERSVELLERQLREAATEAGTEADFHRFLAEQAPRSPVVCDIDLMFAGPPGSPATAGLADPARLVVGEVHSDEETLTHGPFTPFVRQRFSGLADEVLRGYRGLLADGEAVVDVTLRHSDKTFTRGLLDCPDIEACDRSPAPAGRRRLLADFLVASGPGGLRLVERATGQAVRLVALPFAWRRIDRRNPMTVFGFPKRGAGRLFDPAPGEHIPEVGFGDVVLSRRCWGVDAAALRARHAEDGFLAVQRLRDRLGLPRHVFAGSPQEVKPIYVDLDSPLLVRQLTRFAAGATSIRLSEMLPGPDELWVGSRGERYTSELRFSAFAGAPSAGAPGVGGAP